MSAAAPKKPINRKLAYMAIVGVGLVGMLGVIAVSQNDPRVERAAEAEEKAQEQIRQLPAGTEAKARETLDREAQAAEKRLRDQAAREEAERRAFDRFAGSGTPPGSAQGTGNMPGLDPELLRQLDEAQQSVARRPTPRSMSGNVLPPISGGQGTGAAAGGVIHENYKDSGGGIAGDLFGGGGGSASATDPGVYETLKPQAAPSARVISQGTMIPAVLQSAIDTRNEGPMVAVVMRDIYDSRNHRVPLIPKGSRLVGSYGSNVDPGVDRIPATFERLILPDGRAFVLPSFPTSGLDGTIGVEGKYKSNFLRAIGPVFAIAVLGEAVDRRLDEGRDQSNGANPGLGGLYEAPSVLQETMPEVSKAVMDRYRGARPYFVVKPGQEVRVITTADLELPVPGEAS